MFRKFAIKCIAIGVIIGLPLLFRYYVDTFNVFHWQNIRFTSAEPNKNFVKTQYIIHTPDKFNAFVFGSSRVGYIPPNRLPRILNNDTPLHWYNMTCSEGIPAEHLLTIRTFLENHVHIDMILLGFDNISMYASEELHKALLLRIPHQVYEKNQGGVYKLYLLDSPDISVIKEVIQYNSKTHEKDSKIFYDYGTFPKNNDFSLTESPQIERYMSFHQSPYTQKDAHKDIIAISNLCAENKIPLVLFTNPIYETTYRDAVGDGYFDFLRAVAQECEFYNFSSLNNYSTNPHYYFEGSHYRPALGLLVEKILFGTDEERTEIRREVGDELWGEKVNAENVDFIISELKNQLTESDS